MTSRHPENAKTDWRQTNFFSICLKVTYLPYQACSETQLSKCHQEEQPVEYLYRLIFDGILPS